MQIYTQMTRPPVQNRYHFWTYFLTTLPLSVFTRNLFFDDFDHFLVSPIVLHLSQAVSQALQHSNFFNRSLPKSSRNSNESTDLDLGIPGTGNLIASAALRCESNRDRHTKSILWLPTQSESLSPYLYILYPITICYSNTITIPYSIDIISYLTRPLLIVTSSIANHRPIL